MSLDSYVSVFEEEKEKEANESKSPSISNKERDDSNSLGEFQSASASGLIAFHREKPDKICYRLRLIKQKKKGGNNSNRLDDKCFAFFELTFRIQMYY